MPAFEYQAIDSKEGDGEGGTDSTSKKCTNLLCTRNVAVGVISACVLLWLFATKAATNAHLIQTAHKDKVEDFRPIMHISDTHVDPFFDPTVSMMKGVCHRCDFNSKIWGKDTFCPDKSEIKADHDNDDFDRRSGYAFGRYGCNPPYLLWKSLYTHMKSIDPDPQVIVFTGDISPHGYPDDKFELTANTTVEELCATKFLITKNMIRDLVRTFPNTKWAYTMGNNDHLPKNVYWQPYIDKYGKMLLEEGFFSQQQYDHFVNNGGANYVDVGHTRYLSLDFSLYMDGGEASFKKSQVGVMRAKSNAWAEEALKDAASKNMNVYIIGHQPLTTKKGKDEYDIRATHFTRLKALLAKYSPIIRVGLFGHRNVAGFGEVLNKDFLPLFPSLTAPGVSPRGRNQPSFNVLYQSKEDSTVMDFEQWKFDLQTENNNAQILDDPTYLGTWARHNNDLKSWRILSGESNFTVATVSRYLKYVSKSQSEFFDIEEWKRAGYIGDDTPESYYCKHLFDVEDMMMKCLFPNQDAKCWDSGWLT